MDAELEGIDVPIGVSVVVRVGGSSRGSPVMRGMMRKREKPK